VRPASRLGPARRRPFGEEHAEGGTGDGEQQAFGEQLAESTGAAGAERGRTAISRARAEERAMVRPGDVGAGDQQHERDGAGEDEQRGTDAAGEALLHGDEVDVPLDRLRGARVFLAILLRVRPAVSAARRGGAPGAMSRDPVRACAGGDLLG